jgi:hypothetical protein
MSDGDAVRRWNVRLRAEGLRVLGVLKLPKRQTDGYRVTKRQMEVRQMDARRRESFAADMAAYLARPETYEMVRGPPRQEEERSPEGHSSRCLCCSCIRSRQD